MVEALEQQLEQQLEQPATHSDLSFEERLGLLIDRETTYRGNNKVQRLLRAAKLKLQAYPEDVDYQHPRALEKNRFASLLSCQWIEQHQNVIITGPTGCGKTYLGCVLATQACRQGYSVRYFRASRLLDTLAIAHGNGRFTKIINQIAKTDLLVLDLCCTLSYVESAGHELGVSRCWKDFTQHNSVYCPRNQSVRFAF